MASEDNFLRLDPYNYDTEWEYMIANYTFSLSEVINLFKQGLITAEEYMYAVDYLST